MAPLRHAAHGQQTPGNPDVHRKQMQHHYSLAETLHSRYGR